MEFTDRELNIAHAVACKCVDKSQYEDTKSFLHLWMVEHYNTVERYRVEAGGAEKLYAALLRLYYNEVLRMKRKYRPELFGSIEQNKTLRKKIGQDIHNDAHTSVVNYVRRHKHRDALLDYFTGELSGVKTAEKHGLHQMALYRARRNAMIIAREQDPHRYL